MIGRRSGGVFYGWWIVAVSMVGISTCPQPFVLGSMGLFMKPFAAEFGWSRSEISACITVFTIATALCFPLIGRLIDRFGSRKILLPSMFFLAVCLASIALLVSEFWHMLVVFLLIGTLAAGTNTVSYAPVVSAWFDRHRGLAIGLAMSGIGVGFFYVPLLVQYLINAFGWRGAYLGLSAVIVLIAMPLVALVMKDNPVTMNLSVDGDRRLTSSSNYLKSGLESREVVRQPTFWMLMIAFIFISFVLNGVISHLVPMLTDRGTSATLAATVASAVGIAVFMGRVGVGLLVDRIFAPHVAVIIFGLSTIGLLGFGLGAEGVLAFVAAMFVGLSLGAELDLLAYLASRYFGLRSFAAVYGFQLSGIVVGAGLAPLTFGLWFDRSQSYTGILLISAALNLITVILMALLRPYPRWT